MGGDDLVVEDRDVARPRHGRRPCDDCDRAMRQPSTRLALPTPASSTPGIRPPPGKHRRPRGRQRLDRLAEPLFVGQKRAAGLERVTDGCPLKRRELTAQDGRDPGRSAQLCSARERRTASRAAGARRSSRSSASCRQRRTSTPVARDERIELLGNPGSSATPLRVSARAAARTRPDRRVPQHLEQQPLAVDTAARRPAGPEAEPRRARRISRHRHGADVQSARSSARAAPPPPAR